MNILLVYGSMRQDRQGIRLVRFLTSLLKEAGHQPVIADSMETPLPLLDRMYKEYDAGNAPAPMQALADKIIAADGVVMVSGEYNHGIPPALKNLLDHFLEEWYHKPAGIACYSVGRYGGVRAAMQLRMTLPELGMPTIPSLLPVPSISQTLNQDGSTDQGWLVKSAEKFIEELTWWASAAKEKKEKVGTAY